MFSSISKKLPFTVNLFYNLQKILSAILVFSILYFFKIILSSFNSIIDSHHDYDQNLSNLIVLINEKFQIDLESYIKNQSSEISLTGFAEILFDAISNIISSTLMIIIYTIYIY